LIAYGSAPVRLNRLALSAAFILFTLLHLLRFFTITLRNGCFAWSSDESLLVPDSAGTLGYFAVPLRCGLVGDTASGFAWRGAFFEADRERVSGPNPALARDVT
jgi:hypothetical protein